MEGPIAEAERARFIWYARRIRILHMDFARRIDPSVLEHLLRAEHVADEQWRAPARRAGHLEVETGVEREVDAVRAEPTRRCTLVGSATRAKAGLPVADYESIEPPFVA